MIKNTFQFTISYDQIDSIAVYYIISNNFKETIYSGKIILDLNENSIPLLLERLKLKVTVEEAKALFSPKYKIFYSVGAKLEDEAPGETPGARYVRDGGSLKDITDNISYYFGDLLKYKNTKKTFKEKYYNA